MRTLWAPVWLLLGAAAVGCGGEELPRLYPVTGKVVQNGRPMPGGLVQFRPVRDREVITVNGRVGEDGTFELKTRKGGGGGVGAPEGTYHVIYHPHSQDQSVLPITLPKTYQVEAKDNTFTFEVAQKKK